MGGDVCGEGGGVVVVGRVGTGVSFLGGELGGGGGSDGSGPVGGTCDGVDGVGAGGNVVRRMN